MEDDILQHPIERALTGTDDRPVIIPLEHNGVSSDVQQIVNEKPIHRIMCYQAASGMTPGEIAQATGYCVEMVRIVLKQPRSRELIAHILRENFDSDVQNILKSAAVDAVIELAKLSTTATSEAVRRASCVDILDRYKIIDADTKPKTPKDLLKQIETSKQNATEG